MRRKKGNFAIYLYTYANICISHKSVYRTNKNEYETE